MKNILLFAVFLITLGCTLDLPEPEQETFDGEVVLMDRCPWKFPPDYIPDKIR